MERSRGEIRRSIESSYRQLQEVLDYAEGEYLNPPRMEIKDTLAGFLGKVRLAEYREAIESLNDEDYRTYSKMLTEIFFKLVSGPNTMQYNIIDGNPIFDRLAVQEADGQGFEMVNASTRDDWVIQALEDEANGMPLDPYEIFYRMITDATGQFNDIMDSIRDPFVRLFKSLFGLDDEMNNTGMMELSSSIPTRRIFRNSGTLLVRGYPIGGGYAFNQAPIKAGLVSSRITTYMMIDTKENIVRTWAFSTQDEKGDVSSSTTAYLFLGSNLYASAGLRVTGTNLVDANQTFLGFAEFQLSPGFMNMDIGIRTETWFRANTSNGTSMIGKKIVNVNLKELQ